MWVNKQSHCRNLEDSDLSICVSSCFFAGSPDFFCRSIIQSYCSVFVHIGVPVCVSEWHPLRKVLCPLRRLTKTSVNSIYHKIFTFPANIDCGLPYEAGPIGCQLNNISDILAGWFIQTETWNTVKKTDRLSGYHFQFQSSYKQHYLNRGWPVHLITSIKPQCVILRRYFNRPNVDLSTKPKESFDWCSINSITVWFYN